jgi:nucleoside-diphosphate kinase
MRGNRRARLSGTNIMDYLEETLVLIKPDALERRLVGEIIRRFEAGGFTILNVRWASLSPELLENHYADLKSKNPRAFDRNKRYLVGKNAIALVLAGVNAVAKVRLVIGPTEPFAAPPGSIRGDLSSDSIVLADSQDRGLHNLVHAADSADSAKREIALWFG